MRILAVSILLCCYSYTVTGQDPGVLSLYQDSLVRYIKASAKAVQDSEKEEINAKMVRLVDAMLEQPGSWKYPFDSLKKYKVLVESPDKEVRIYNWAMRLEDYSHQYFGYLQHYNKKFGKWEHFFLDDKSSTMKNVDMLQTGPGKWYGAFYNSIIVTKNKKQTFYTLLGWDGNDRITQKKIIETLVFSSIGEPKFGEPILQVEKEISPTKKIFVYQRRIIFEYKQGVFMSLKYHPSQGIILYDHLSPEDPSKVGQAPYYGPDLTLDGYKWEKGKWVFIKDADGRNEKNGTEDKNNVPAPNPLDPQRH